jgi:medium-chain acyl-[acyl-carrier-protein] hydrolase
MIKLQWLKLPAPSPSAPLLLAFPFAGGNAQSIKSWLDELSDSAEIWILELPGRGLRLLEAPITDFSELIDAVCASLSNQLSMRPVVFYGHSFGALVAFELAVAFGKMAWQRPQALIVSGAESPSRRRLKRSTSALNEAEFIEVLRDYGSTPSEVLECAEMMELLLPGIRADFNMSEAYRCIDSNNLGLPIHLHYATDDVFVESILAQSWRELSSGFSCTEYQGGHFFVDQSQGRFTSMLRAQLASVVANNVNV